MTVPDPAKESTTFIVQNVSFRGENPECMRLHRADTPVVLLFARLVSGGKPVIFPTYTGGTKPEVCKDA